MRAVWTFLTTRLVVRRYVILVAATTGPVALVLLLTGAANVTAAVAVLTVNVVNVATGIRIAPRAPRHHLEGAVTMSMPASEGPADYVQPGATVFVVFPTGRLGLDTADGWRRATVDKIHRRHFTVDGVFRPGADPRPILFRNQHGRDGRHPAAGDGREYVIRDGTEESERIIRRATVHAAVKRIDRAVHQWAHDIARQRGNPYPDKRPSPEAVDAALVELIEAAAQARRTLGIPGDDGSTVTPAEETRS